MSASSELNADAELVLTHRAFSSPLGGGAVYMVARIVKEGEENRSAVGHYLVSSC
jgi:hypothetical protein